MHVSFRSSGVMMNGLDLSVNSVYCWKLYSHMRSGGTHVATPVMVISHEGGLSCVHTMFPWQQHQQGPGQTS